MKRARKEFHKKCSVCGIQRAATEFYEDAEMPDGLANECKGCAYDIVGWVAKPRLCEGCQVQFLPNAASQRYHKKCRPYCTITASIRSIILKRDNFRCAYCGWSYVEDIASLHVDHIMPRSKGGKDTAGNLVTACIHCNLGKSDSLLSSELMAQFHAEAERRNQEQGINLDLT